MFFQFKFNRSRGIANGIAASAFYLTLFITKKTYLNLEKTLSLAGVSLLYTCVCFLGLVLMCNILPETEDRTLEDIELHFSDNSKGITNRKIPIRKQQLKSQHEIQSLI